MPSAPEARTHQVHTVERTGAGGVRPEGQRQRQRRREERQRKHQIEGEEPGKLRAIPRDLQRVEREATARARRPRGAPAPKPSAAPPKVHRKCLRSGRCSTATKLPRRAEAEQRDGDDHVGEVMPVHDRQQAREEDFVAQHAGREQRHGNEDAGPRRGVRPLARHRPSVPAGQRNENDRQKFGGS